MGTLTLSNSSNFEVYDSSLESHLDLQVNCSLCYIFFHNKEPDDVCIAQLYGAGYPCLY